MIADSLENGTIKPIQVKIFPKTNVEEAFRYMASGKHIGKVCLYQLIVAYRVIYK